VSDLKRASLSTARVRIRASAAKGSNSGMAALKISVVKTVVSVCEYRSSSLNSGPRYSSSRS
jgi:RNA 3'-terminal phosphate cyclase